MTLQASPLKASRREVFAGLAVAAWALPTIVRAQGAPAPISWAPKALTLDQARTLSAACEAIVPETDTPGAIAAGVPQKIDGWIADWLDPPAGERLKAGIDQLSERARVRGAAGFAALTQDQKVALLSEVEGEQRAADRQRPPVPHYWNTLKGLTTTAYFTSQAGATKAARYDPVPGAYKGCVPLKDIGRVWATT
ncbi:gluconate 2-dehydrogenase subunit 3 family protein [Phenylobacterium sp.]|uniref:gluconate 2-dehydrogenase subunit 3 family protein n=1 Tax=Phenylobacterium sp. TaxID=1871053 RepID=UPI002C705F07|nr:gluconate 2-dehydrogenase subunit 3 family protein [Phenylobacterium sp.]HLZ73605.1 gluconate 2-dehydrogenase subunit 3 family protein [Phenylobacterium sp.]